MERLPLGVALPPGKVCAQQARLGNIQAKRAAIMRHSSVALAGGSAHRAHLVRAGRHHASFSWYGFLSLAFVFGCSLLLFAVFDVVCCLLWFKFVCFCAAVSQLKPDTVKRISGEHWQPVDDFRI